MRFLAALIVDGALAGSIYALIALGFVVVYKASRVINFALGEWLMLARCWWRPSQRPGARLPAALAAAGAGMIAFAPRSTAWCCAGSSADPSSRC